jgi:iron complex transport system substrate-binding protein
MKRLIICAAFSALTLALLYSCGRFKNKDEKQDDKVRIVCVSKQYNEIIYDLGAQQDLVAVDVSSTYPPAIKSLPTVGYHRALTAEGILSTKPTVFMTDGNVGPESVINQLKQLKIPIVQFPHGANTIDSAKMLFHDIGVYFHKEHQADSIAAELDAGMKTALDSAKKYTDIPKVMILQFGRVVNGYLIITGKGVPGKIIKWAGGVIPFKGGRGMAPLSAEAIAQADPDVILMTDFGYDRLGGSMDKIKRLPGLAATKAGRNNRIYRIDERDINYIVPSTGDAVLKLEKLIHGKPAS